MRTLIVAFIVALTAPALAGAEAQPRGESAPGKNPALVVPGVVFAAGTGVTAFSGEVMRQQADTGGLWELRAVFGTRGFLGAEAAYVGWAAGISALGLPDRASIVSTGLEGLARLNMPLLRGAVLVEPFGFAGLGWTRFDLAADRRNTSSMRDRDDVVSLPFGGGIAVGYRRLMIDSRFTYRAAFEEDLARTANGSAASLGTWSWSTLIGFAL
jgi:hypothetical protein